MNQIEKSISNLSSPDKDTRYKACVELRLADSIPEPAIAALEAATHDPDPLVAEAARRALEIHTPPPPTEESPSTSRDLPLQEAPNEDTPSSLPDLKKRIRWLWVIFAVLLGISLLGEFASITLSRKGWTRITEINGEKLNYVYMLSLAPDGAIWIGDEDTAQVYRFDGASWNEYTTDNSLSEYLITAIAESPGGELWIGTDKGVYRSDGIHWTSFTAADGLPGSNIESISIAPDGSVWVVAWDDQGSSGLSRFDGESWTSYFEDMYFFTDIAISTDNRIWAMATDSLLMFDGQEWAVYQYPVREISNDSFLFVAGDLVWVYDREMWGLNTKILCFNEQQWIDCPIADVSSSAFSPQGMTVFSDGSLWFVSQDGESNWNLTRFAQDTWTTFTMPFHHGVTAYVNIVADQQDQIWFSHDDALMIFNPNEVVSRNVALIIRAWKDVRYGLFAITGLSLIILLMNINLSTRQDQKIYRGLLFLTWILGSILVYIVGIATLGRLFSVEGVYLGKLTAADLFLGIWPLTILIILMIGILQWGFFRRYMKSLQWLFPAMIAGFLVFIFITYLFSRRFIINYSDYGAFVITTGYLACPGAIAGIIVGGVFLILLSRRRRKSAT